MQTVLSMHSNLYFQSCLQNLKCYRWLSASHVSCSRRRAEEVKIRRRQVLERGHFSIRWNCKNTTGGQVFRKCRSCRWLAWWHILDEDRRRCATVCWFHLDCTQSNSPPEWICWANDATGGSRKGINGHVVNNTEVSSPLNNSKWTKAETMLLGCLKIKHEVIDTLKSLVPVKSVSYKIMFPRERPHRPIPYSPKDPRP